MSEFLEAVLKVYGPKDSKRILYLSSARFFSIPIGRVRSEIHVSWRSTMKSQIVRVCVHMSFQEPKLGLLNVFSNISLFSGPRT